MKKLSLYVFLVLMWCNFGFAEERYSELMKKSKTGKGDKIIEVLKESNFAYELEMSFAEECLYELKVLKEKGGKRCSKMMSRMDGVQNLLQILLEPNFKKEFLKIGEEFDSGKRSKTEFMKVEKMMSEHLRKQNKITEIYSNITFLFKNL